MKSIAKDEIFNNLSGFLKSRGIELTDGSYSKGIQQSCSLLTNAINLGQESLEKAKVEFEKTCDNMRQVIHEKTAPKGQKPPPVTAAGPAAAARKSGARRKARSAPAKPAKKRAS